MWVRHALIGLCIVAGAQVQESLVVQIDQGPVRGYKDADGDIYTFLNIPYATAPTGRDKFKAPLPAPVWTETFDAVDRGIVCPQFLPIPSQEDCLVADIIVPADTNTTSLPVMVYVHGGAYILGSSVSFSYRNLVKTQNVIVVTFNYRLGVHGFLCLGTPDVPGNAGMKDQVALLRWVNRNIASFGGNPRDVTIAGCSAGGGSVDLLTLSHMTTGLFNKVITESGASLGSVGVQMNPTENAIQYARSLNFSNVDDMDALEEFYKTGTNEFLQSQLTVDTKVLLFAPCVERDTGNGEEMFISDSPWNILSSGQYPKLPLLYGYVEHESLFFIDTFDRDAAKMSANFSHYLPFDLQFENDEQREEVADVVREFYFGDKEVNSDTVLDFVNYYTDVTFAYPMLKGLLLRRNANNDTVYLYEYTFVDDNTPTIPHTDVRGVEHCAQAFAVMDQDTTNSTDEYLRMKATMRELWLNFIISGNPVPDGSSPLEWSPVAARWAPHMILDTVPKMNDTLILEERALFWEAIYDKHYRQPVPPVSGSATSLYSNILITSVFLSKIIRYLM